MLNLKPASLASASYPSCIMNMIISRFDSWLTRPACADCAGTGTASLALVAQVKDAAVTAQWSVELR